MSQDKQNSPHDTNTGRQIPIPRQWLIDALKTPDHPARVKTRSMVQGRISHIQRDINDIDKNIYELQRRRAMLDDEYYILKRLLSAAHSIPPELLWEIFQFCADAWWEDVDTWICQLADTNTILGGSRGWERVPLYKDNSDWPGWHNWRPQPAYTLSQVCKSWRAAARSCPKLWSDIFLTLPGVKSTAAQKLLEHQVALSGNHPLRIHMASNPNYYILSPSQLRSTCYRWTTLTTETIEPLQALSQSNGVSLPLPFLVSLTISLPHNVPDISFKLSAADAPLLTDVSLHNKRMGHNIELELPWAQIRRIRICNYHGHDALAIVQSLHKVEDLDLRGIDDYDHIPLDPSIKTLPFLTCLRITNNLVDYDSPAIILRYLQLPKLRAVVWTRMRGPDIAQLQTTLDQSLSKDRLSLLELHLHSYEELPEITNPENPPAVNLRSAFEHLIRRIGSRLDVFTLSCSKPHPHGFSYLLNFVCDGIMPYLRVFRLEGALVGAKSVSRIIHEAWGYLDIRLLNCTFELQETFWNDSLYHIVQWLSQTPPKASRLGLYMFGPDSKRLLYCSLDGRPIVGHMGFV